MIFDAMSISSELPLTVACHNLAADLGFAKHILNDSICDSIHLRIRTPPPLKLMTQWMKRFAKSLNSSVSIGRHNGAIHRILAHRLTNTLFLNSLRRLLLLFLFLC